MKVIDVRPMFSSIPALDEEATSSAQDTIVVEVVDRRGPRRNRRDRSQRLDRARLHRGSRHPHDGPWPEADADRARSARPGGASGTTSTSARRCPVAAARSCTRSERSTSRCGTSAGRPQGVPCWQLWGESERTELTPYASLQPEVESFDAYIESMVGWATRAREMGFKACKLEATFSGPYVHKGLVGSDERITEVVTAVREAVGPEHDDHGRRAVRVRLGRAGAARGRGLGRPRCVLPRDAALDRRRRRLRRALGSIAGADCGGRVALDPPRLRGADRRRAACRSRSPTSAGLAGSRRHGACATWRPSVAA